MQKKGIELYIYRVPSNGLCVQNPHKIIEDLAKKIWEPNLSKTSHLID